MENRATTTEAKGPILHGHSSFSGLWGQTLFVLSKKELRVDVKACSYCWPLLNVKVSVEKQRMSSFLFAELIPYGWGNEGDGDGGGRGGVDRDRERAIMFDEAAELARSRGAPRNEGGILAGGAAGIRSRQGRTFLQINVLLNLDMYCCLPLVRASIPCCPTTLATPASATASLTGMTMTTVT